MPAWLHPSPCGAFPRENDSPAPRLRALRAFPRRERVVYPDGHGDAVAALSAFLVSEPAPPTPPKEREKRDSLLCDGDTVDAVLGSVFD